MNIKFLLIAILLFGVANINAQTTVTLKPDATEGKDALLWMLDGDCIPAGLTATPATLNYGSEEELSAEDWTWSTGGCNSGNYRSLIEFTQIADVIPTGATITSAELKLYGISSSVWNNLGNNYYPGSSFTKTNESWLRRVTSSWNENTVTWNTMPSYDLVNQIALPYTTSQWNWNYTTSSDATASNNIKALVQFWLDNPTENHGLLWMLKIEDHYRDVLFASSDHTDSTLWPELVITYTTDSCHSEFTITNSTSDPNTYTFGSEYSNPAATYTWTIDGVTFSGSTVTHTFPGPGTYTVCLTVSIPDDEKQTCGTICKDIVIGTSINNVLLLNKNSYQIYPNPTNDIWNIKFTNNNYTQFTGETIYLKVIDVTGRIISNESFNLNNNIIPINARQYPSGIYVIELSSNKGTLLRNKVVKQ